MKLKWMYILVLPFTVMACAYTVPLTRKATIDNPPNPKHGTPILVVMSAGEAEKVVKFSPQPGDTYIFEGGLALRDLLVSALGQVYSEVTFSLSREGSPKTVGISVEARLVSHDIVMNIYKGHTVTLGIEYTIRDPRGTVVKEMTTKTSSKDEFSLGEKIGAFTLIPLYAIGKNKDKVGAAWDTAALNSVGQLLGVLLDITG